jgi:ribonuclease E
MAAARSEEGEEELDESAESVDEIKQAVVDLAEEDLEDEDLDESEDDEDEDDEDEIDVDLDEDDEDLDDDLDIEINTDDDDEPDESVEDDGGVDGEEQAPIVTTPVSVVAPRRPRRSAVRPAGPPRHGS